MSSPHETEVLVIGCGIAGGITALQLAEAGIPVTLATLTRKPEESATYYAQGGIVFRGREDSPQSLKDDILRAGAGLCNPTSVDILVKEGPQLVEDLLLTKLHVPFDRLSDGKVSLVREGGHSLDRIAHATDATGRAIETRLIEALEAQHNITWLSSHTAVDLLTPAHHSKNRPTVYDPLSCVGAYFLNQTSGAVFPCLAKKTVLATGGLGQLYLRTTNPQSARGDGLAMAYRAGARVINCEFVQFHPTAFYQSNQPCFLISEAARGAGARVVDEHGEPFMQKYDPQWKDLAARDVVARSIYQEMFSRGVPNLYLDMRSYISATKIKDEFPTVFEQCMKHGIDVTHDLIPIVPAAHYFCGGVWVDEWGRTTVRDLFATGEVSCTGVHGANRLASTSLLEGLVWGNRAAKAIRDEIQKTRKPDPRDIPEWRTTETETADPALISQDMSTIKHIMWNYVGLVRTKHRLQRALRELRHLEIEIERFYRAVRLSDGLLGLRNAVRAALIISLSAWENNESRGCHYREGDS